MNLLKKLFDKIKTFEGTVIDVQLVEGFFSCEGKQYNRYSKQNVKAIIGYDNEGMPIVDGYLIGQFNATVLNPQSEIRTFERHGRVPEVGSKQSYREAA